MSKYEHLIKAFLGDDGFEALCKGIQRKGMEYPLGLQDMFMSLMVVPKSLLSWVAQVCRSLNDKENKVFDIPGFVNTKLLLNKWRSDVYKGQITREGELVYEFDNLTIPELAAHIMSVLEIYDEAVEKPKEIGYLDIIQKLTPVIDKLVEERIKIAPVQPSVVIHNHIVQPKEEVIEEQPSLPIFDSDSYRAGFHMTMANFFRKKSDVDAVEYHEKSLQDCIKNVGYFSSLKREEFDAGSKDAVVKIAKGDLESQFNKKAMPSETCKETMAKLPDGSGAFTATIGKEEKEDKAKLIEEHKRLVDVLESPSHEDDKKEAKVQSKELKELQKDVKLSKSELATRCPECGNKEFIGDKFVGCACLGIVNKNGILVKHHDGQYHLEFDSNWSTEDISNLLSVLKRK